MTKKAPQYQTDLLNSVLNHLDPDAAGFQGSESVEEALRDPALSNYLKAWVLPPLVAMRDGEVRPWMRRAAAGTPRYETRKENR